MLKKIDLNLLINLLTIGILLGLPYYIFEGKLYVGGDDTRLLYSYPFEFLKANSFFAWHNLSSLGIYFSGQFIIPFLLILSILEKILNNDVVLSYLAFSLPLIVGFIYFKLFVKELFELKDTYDIQVYIGSLFYILSPIIILDQLFIFLTSIWLLGLVPAVGYYYLKYLKTSNFLYIYVSMLFCLIFALALWSAPWLFGFLVPIIPGLIIIGLFHKRKEIFFFLRKSAIFFFFILLSQAFWFLGFLAPFLAQDKTSLAVKLISKDFFNTFVATVEATSKGYIIYPLLNLFHRQIAFDFDWKLKNEFINFYDKTFFLNFIFIVIIVIGFFYYRKYLDRKKRKIYLFVVASFLLSLYFFTVNIGPLKDLFFLLGHIPGFVMFRNFYDKFAPGYVFIYAMLITISLVLIKMKFPNKHYWLSFFVFFVIILNFFPVKTTVNSPLWTTDNVYKTLNIPDEYINFMSRIRSTVSPTNTILSIPFGAAGYTIIKDVNSDNVYVGTSPVKIFSGVNDISGSLSFNFTEEANIIDKIIVERNYEELNKILYEHNINYVLLTKNIPDQVLRSYVFNYQTLEKQDEEFLEAITDKKILVSDAGNYELYTTKKRNTLIKSQDLLFKKVNSVKYILYFKNIKNPRELEFLDSFHAGWKLYINRNPNPGFCTKVVFTTGTVKECQSEFKLYELSEMPFLWAESSFDRSHSTEDGSSNKWTIDPKFVQERYDSDYYKINKDGSIDVEVTLYFKPQLYHYYGSIISLSAIIFGAAYLLYKRYRRI